ncbi:DinB family protein [Rubrivirga sp. IMCC43871]|uniref:DinB family protein n=1 Tax=Rubrivirga sp. IMCC43871 TaxID=3391575 RepID=UPI00399001C9
MIVRPEAREHGRYYDRYVALVEDDDLLTALTEPVTSALVRAADSGRASHAYAPGKWTVAGVVQHVIDTERVFAYRALRVARGDDTPLPGYDQDGFAAHAPDRPLGDLADELDRVRASTLDLLAALAPHALARIGTASDQPLSARGAGWIIAGHDRHHAAVLRERYLP